MSGFPSAVKPTWVKISERRQEIRVISQLTPWVSHWDPKQGKSRKCGRELCALCGKGVSKQLRVIVMGLDAQNREVLLELRERHREVLDRYDSTVGLVLQVRRRGSASNSPIDLVVTGEFEAVERDIRALVDCFGLEPILMGGQIEEAS